MFDIFRDIALELQGIDSEKAGLEREKKRLEKKNRDKEEKVILPIWAKKFVSVIAIFYLLSCMGTLPIMFNTNIALLAIRSVVQIVVAIAILILINIKNKKTEIASIVLIAIFFILQNSGLLILANG